MNQFEEHRVVTSVRYNQQAFETIGTIVQGFSNGLLQEPSIGQEKQTTAMGEIARYI